VAVGLRRIGLTPGAQGEGGREERREERRERARKRGEIGGERLEN
jgi:hypothetical protein